MAKVLGEVESGSAAGSNGAGLTAEDYVERIERALAEGSHLMAQDLSQAGSRDFPLHPRLRKLAILMSAPKILKEHLPSDPTIEEDYAWLRAHGGDYQGQWVALKRGKLYGAAGSLRELKQNNDLPKGVLLTKIR